MLEPKFLEVSASSIPRRFSYTHISRFYVNAGSSSQSIYNCELQHNVHEKIHHRSRSIVFHDPQSKFCIATYSRKTDKTLLSSSQRATLADVRPLKCYLESMNIRDESTWNFEFFFEFKTTKTGD